MVIICPYCDIEISEKLVEAEDGCCPECGTSITARNVIEEPEEDIYAKEFEDSLEDDEYEPDFVDDFDMEEDDILDDPEDEIVEFQKPRRIREELEEELGSADDEDFPFDELEEAKEEEELEETVPAVKKEKKEKSTAKAPKKASSSKKSEPVSKSSKSKKK
ncbi:MAG: hypothetical protein J6S53_09455 [Lentisphaeria bacterium]|nr:hypothetical protein [Lentisphaeria bacterium]